MEYRSGAKKLEKYEVQFCPGSGSFTRAAHSVGRNVAVQLVGLVYCVPSDWSVGHLLPVPFSHTD
jgi:hypothetical protein